MCIDRSWQPGSGRRTRMLAAFICAAALAACAGGDSADTAADTAAAPPVASGAPAAGSGEQLYQRCITCHQANGEGVAGAFPPLAGSEYATAANPAVPIRVVLHGMQGPVTVKGQQFSGMMPQYGTGIAMTDQEVAAVLTYVRQAWGNNASAVTAEQVAAERAAPRAASGPVTAEELQSMMSGG